jgi:hypothetical protein
MSLKCSVSVPGKVIWQSSYGHFFRNKSITHLCLRNYLSNTGPYGLLEVAWYVEGKIWIKGRLYSTLIQISFYKLCSIRISLCNRFHIRHCSFEILETDDIVNRFSAITKQHCWCLSESGLDPYSREHFIWIRISIRIHWLCGSISCWESGSWILFVGQEIKLCMYVSDCVFVLKQTGSKTVKTAGFLNL